MKGGEINEIRKENLPLCVGKAGLYCLQGETQKLRRKYDSSKWTATSCYRGIAKVKCINNKCNFERFIWLCSKKCPGAETKDSRCCQFTVSSSALFIKYIGEHDPECEALNPQPQPQPQICGTTLEERACRKLRKKVTVVDTLPEDLIGDEVFIIKCSDTAPGKSLRLLVNDGRSYDKVPTTNKELSSLFMGENKVNVFKYNCTGSIICNNQNCRFYKRFNLVHQVSVGDASHHKKCTCENDLSMLPCSAERLVAFQNLDENNNNDNEILVKYKGRHTCLAKSKVLEETKVEIEEYFLENPSTKPSIAFFNLFTKKIEQGASSTEIDQLMIAQVNSWVMTNAKASARKKLNPGNDLISSLLHIKEKYVDTEAVQKYGVIMDVHAASEFCPSCNQIFTNEELSGFCPTCNTVLTDTEDFVFVSSKACLETMNEMSYGNVLYGSSCHIDHQPGRTKEYNTFEGVVYDPDIRSIVNLFTFHMRRESERYVAAAFSYLHDALSARELTFVPFGFVSDEGGGLLGGVERMFPEIAVNTDDFHYKQNYYQLVSREIGGRNDIITFLRFCKALQDASSPTVYIKVLHHFYKWIELSDARNARVHSFLDWWDNRRSHWATAFKNNDVAGHSLAESGNSKIARKNLLKNSPIDDCLRYEIMQAMKHVSKLEGIRNGTYKGGRGPTRPVLKQRELDYLQKRVSSYPANAIEANSMVEDILRTVGLPYLDIIDEDEEYKLSDDPLYLLNEDIDIKSKKTFEVDVTSPHKFSHKRNLKQKHQKPGRPRNSKKARVAIDDEFEDIELSDIDEESLNEVSRILDNQHSVPKAPRLHGVYKRFPNAWKYMGDKVEKMVGDYQVTKKGDMEFHVTKNDDNTTRIISFTGNNTSCTCEDFAKKQGVPVNKDPARSMTTYNCKHIVFVMRQLGIDKSNLMLRKHHLSSSDVEVIRKSSIVQQTPTSATTTTNATTIRSLDSAKFAAKDLPSAKLKLREQSCTWSATYYEPRNTRGPKPSCGSEEKGKHGLEVKELCLRVVYRRIFKPSTKDFYMMKEEARYFCPYSNCFTNPKKNLTGMYTNFISPTWKLIDSTKINEKDRSRLQAEFDK